MQNVDWVQDTLQPPGLVQLFIAFLGISIMGFGGVMPWARWMMVERRKWLTPYEFSEALALSQGLPGGNIINLSVIVGNRFAGVAGAVAAVGGLMIAPVAPRADARLALLTLRRSGGPQRDASRRQFGRRGSHNGYGGQDGDRARGIEWIALLAAAAAFVAVAIFRVPLLVTMAVLVPLTVAYAWRRVQ